MRLSYIFFLLILTNISIAQHLTFDDFTYLYKNDIEKCDLLLTNRGFIFSKSIKETDGTVSSLWLYKRGATLESSNEYFYKNCSNGKCNKVDYIISDVTHFNSLKENATKSGAKYLWSDPDTKTGLSFYYLYPGPSELKFTSLPSSTYSNVKVYLISLKEMNVEVK